MNFLSEDFAITFRKNWYDDEEPQEQINPQFKMKFIGKFTPLVKVLFFFNLLVIFLQLIFAVTWETRLTDFLGVKPGATFTLTGVYRLFTYMWVHSLDYPLHIIFNLFGVWLCGGMLEEKISWRRMLWIYLLSGIGGGIAAALFSKTASVTIGASGAIFGIIVAWGYFLAGREVMFLFVFRLKIKYIAMFLVGANAVFCLSPYGAKNVSYVGHLGGALVGAILVFASPLYIKRRDRLKIRSHLKKVEKDADIRKRMDVLLEKISREGISNLTDEERRFMKTASKKFNRQ